MSVIVPFKALRPRQGLVKAVASLPYDVFSSEEAKLVAGGNPSSFLHVEKSEIDLPSDISPHDQLIYDTAKSNLDKMIREGVLFQEQKAYFYIYSQEMKGRRQFGIAGGISVVEYETGKIKKHELTRADKERDRTCHVDTVGAHTGPVFITYRRRPEIDRLVEEAVTEPPEYEFTADDGISHTVWTVRDEDKIAAVIREFAGINGLYIADGHHRAAAAAAVAKMRRERHLRAENPEYEYIMAVLFPHTQLKIMDYNRVVRDLHGLSAGEFLQRCRESFVLSDNYCDRSPRVFHEFGMYLGGSWYKLVAREGSYQEGDSVSSLDVSILQERLLGPVLAVHDPRTDERIGFVGGIRGMEELERLVDSGSYAVAFSLYPPTIKQLMEVADSGRIMPPKSTWFEPKLRSGIFTHLLD